MIHLDDLAQYGRHGLRSTSVPTGFLIHPCSRLATIHMGLKVGVVRPFLGVSPSNTIYHIVLDGDPAPSKMVCRLDRGLSPYQVASSSIQPFGHSRQRPKIGSLCPFGGGGLVPI